MYFMQKIKIPVNSLVLTLINLGAIFLSLEILNTSQVSNNLAWAAAFLAVIFSILGYWIYRYIVKSFNEKFVIIQGIAFVYFFIFALIWMAVVYVIGYFLIRGAWPEFENLVMLWTFQLPTNFLALYIVYKIGHKK